MKRSKHEQDYIEIQQRNNTNDIIFNRKNKKLT